MLFGTFAVILLQCVFVAVGKMSPKPTTMHADWRDSTFYVDVVTRDKGYSVDQFSIKSIAIVPATAKPAGFESFVHRVTLEVEMSSDGTSVSLPYVVKECVKERTRSSFIKEIEALENLLPAFERLFGGNVRLGPKIFKTALSPTIVIVMDDLKAAGYTMKDVEARLDMEDSNKVLSKVAKLHAASAVYAEKNGSFSDMFNDAMYKGDSVNKFGHTFKLMYEAFLESVRGRDHLNHLADKLAKWRENPLADVVQLLRFDATSFNVLNHGDLWITNYMIRENDALLIDFQGSFYGSAAFDVLLFILNSVKDEDLADNLDNLIELYHRELTESLKLLEYGKAIPSVDKLWEDIRKLGFLAVFLLVDTIPLDLTMIGLETKLLSSNDAEGAQFRHDLFNNPRYLQILDKLLPLLNDRGFLS